MDKLYIWKINGLELDLDMEDDYVNKSVKYYW